MTAFYLSLEQIKAISDALLAHSLGAGLRAKPFWRCFPTFRSFQSGQG
jgi:hypothetical protein